MKRLKWSYYINDKWKMRFIINWIIEYRIKNGRSKFIISGIFDKLRFYYTVLNTFNNIVKCLLFCWNRHFCQYLITVQMMQLTDSATYAHYFPAGHSRSHRSMPLWNGDHGCLTHFGKGYRRSKILNAGWNLSISFKNVHKIRKKEIFVYLKELNENIIFWINFKLKKQWYNTKETILIFKK